MSGNVVHGAVTFLVDSAESITGACTPEALTQYIKALTSEIDTVYAKLPEARGERSLIVCVNLDVRVRCWLLLRSEALESLEESLVIEALTRVPPPHVFKLIGFAMHFGVGGVPITVKQLSFVPPEWEDLYTTGPSPTSFAEFFDRLWSR